MSGKTILASAVVACLALSSSAAFALDGKPIFSDDQLTVFLPHGPPSKKSLTARPPKPVNYCKKWSWHCWIGPGSENIFFPYLALAFSGPTSPNGQVWQAQAFIPTETKTVSALFIGLGYISGTNSVNIGIYNDEGGVPGTAIRSADVTGVPDFGICCEISGIQFRKTKLVAGTQYWIVLSTDSDSADAAFGAYDNTVNERDPGLMASNRGSGWVSRSSVPLFNYEIR